MNKNEIKKSKVRVGDIYELPNTPINQVMMNDVGPWLFEVIDVAEAGGLHTTTIKQK